MEISYVGHSCFRLRGREASIVTDPFSPKYGIPLGRPTASIVTLSQRAGGDYLDHTNVEGVAGEPRVIDGPGEYEIADVLIAGVRTRARDDDGGSTNGAGPRLNTIYVIDVDQLRICHLGDVGERLTADQVEQIGSVNVLLVPVGGGGVIGPNLAAEIVSQIEPNIVIPMHYRIAGTRSDGFEPVERFLNEMGSKSVTPEPKLSLNAKSSLPTDIQVMVLENK